MAKSEYTAQPSEDRFKWELARKDQDAANASVMIDQLTREKNAADGTVRRELDPDGMYGPEWTLRMVINSVKKRTLTEARICRDALVREKKKRRDTTARVEREDVVRVCKGMLREKMERPPMQLQRLTA